MNCKECVIGIINYEEYYDLATVAELEHLVEYRIEFNKRVRSEYGEIDDLLYKEWSLADYFDRRKSTNLTRFDYCPFCGKKIDWRWLKRERA